MSLCELMMTTEDFINQNVNWAGRAHHVVAGDPTTEFVKCLACGIKTTPGRNVCPRCKTSLRGATVYEMPTHVPHTLEPDTPPVRGSDTGPPESDEADAAKKSIFDTGISELFPKRRRFGVIDLLLVAGVIAWLVVLSDVRVWVEDGVVSFATSSARTGATWAAIPPGPEPQPVPGENDSERPAEALPEPDPLPPAAVSMEAGNQLFEDGEFPAALAQFEAAVEVAPDNAEIRNNLGQTLVRLERRNEALPHFEHAVRLDSARWAYHFNLAQTLGDVGSWNRAASQYRRAVALFPDDFATRYNLGRALHEWGDRRAAVIPYLEAIPLAPEEPTIYLSLAQSYEALARPADVITAYARYLEMEPESAQADKIRTRMDALQHPANAGLGRQPTLR